MHSNNSKQADLESVAAGLRRLTDLLLRVDADDPGPATVADELDTIVAMLENRGGPRLSGVEDPASGRGNALAPPLDVEIGDDGTASATVHLGLPYQGPKALVHGGISALMLSHVLSAAGSVDGEPAVVQELAVRYHRPTPLFAELHISAARADPAVGHAQGTIDVGGVTTVSAQAQIAPPPH